MNGCSANKITHRPQDEPVNGTHHFIQLAETEAMARGRKGHIIFCTNCGETKTISINE
jgi:hypothetical protein